MAETVRDGKPIEFDPRDVSNNKQLLRKLNHDFIKWCRMDRKDIPYPVLIFGKDEITCTVPIMKELFTNVRLEGIENMETPPVDELGIPALPMAVFRFRKSQITTPAAQHKHPAPAPAPAAQQKRQAPAAAEPPKPPKPVAPQETPTPEPAPQPVPIPAPAPALVVVAAAAAVPETVVQQVPAQATTLPAEYCVSHSKIVQFFETGFSDMAKSDPASYAGLVETATKNSERWKSADPATLMKSPDRDQNWLHIASIAIVASTLQPVSYVYDLPDDPLEAFYAASMEPAAPMATIANPLPPAITINESTPHLAYIVSRLAAQPTKYADLVSKYVKLFESVTDMDSLIAVLRTQYPHLKKVDAAVIEQHIYDTIINFIPMKF